MFEIQAENRDLTDRDINQPKETHKKGLLLGTDFRHAVEFSRNGRATTPAPAGFVVGGGPTLPRVRAATPKGTPRLASRPARRIENHTRFGRAVHRGSSGRQERWLRARGGSRSRR